MNTGNASAEGRSAVRSALLSGVMVSVAAAVTGTAGAAAATPVLKHVPDLAAVCRPEVIQAAVAKLSPAITVQTLQNPMGPALQGGATFTEATAQLPAYCQVSGTFVTNPRTGKTAGFLATFPANWNGKYLQLGCSGHCGQFAVSNPALPSIIVTNQGYPGQILEKGYAAIATDEGHAGFDSGRGWAVNKAGQADEDAIDDFYYRADQVLARLGKQFTLAFYGQALQAPQKLAYSYFSGCSGGGRDALVATSYFPEEFDGIVAGSPYNLVGTGFLMTGISLASIRSPDAAVTPADLKRVDALVKAKCDQLDGVEDGLVQNPAACDFIPDRDLPKCATGATHEQCFTQGQIDTVNVAVSAVTDEDGNVVQPGYAITELNPGIAPTRDPQADDPWPDSLTSATLRNFVHKNDPNFRMREVIKLQVGGPGPARGLHTVVPKAEVAKALEVARLGIGHFPENADRLIRQKRKLLIWHNLSDQALTPYMSVNYYKQLAKRHGGYAKLQNTVRLFGLPGTAHCSISAIGPNNFDVLGAIEDWVEKGKAPEALEARLYPREPGADVRSTSIDRSKPPLRSMPLCKFPEMARYRGQGDVKVAANWSCPAADTSMLKVGDSGRQAGVME